MIVFFVNRRLAFGSKAAKRRHIEKLRALGITHILDVRKYRVKCLDQFNRLCLSFKDNARPRPPWFYRRALTFYRRAMKQPKAKVFVMCRKGMRRSASMAYFLLRASGMGKAEADATIRRARPCAQIVRAYRESGEQFLSNQKLKRKS